MKQLNRIFIASSIIALVACSDTAVNPDQVLINSMNNQFIKPTYHEFTLQTESLAKSTENWTCDTGISEQQQADIQAQWQNTMNAWQAAKAIHFGPVTDERIDWKLQFWPDKKNLVASKTLGLFKQEITEENLQGASVVTQGISALEYLLYDERFSELSNQPELGTKHCQLTKLVAQNIQTNAVKIESSWTSYEPSFIGDGSETWNADTSIGNIFDSVLLTLEEVANQKIGSPIGSTNNYTQANFYFLESWRSKHSAENIQASLSAVLNLFNNGGLKNYLSEKGMPQLSQEIALGLEEAINLTHNLDKPLAEHLSEQAEELKQIQQRVNAIKTLIKNKVVTNLELPIGFNDNDGD